MTPAASFCFKYETKFLRGRDWTGLADPMFGDERGDVVETGQAKKTPNPVDASIRLVTSSSFVCTNKLKLENNHQKWLAFKPSFKKYFYPYGPNLNEEKHRMDVFTRLHKPNMDKSTFLKDKKILTHFKFEYKRRNEIRNLTIHFLGKV